MIGSGCLVLAMASPLDAVLPANDCSTAAECQSGAAETLGHPIRGLAPIAVGAVVDDMAAVFDEQQLHRPLCRGRAALGLLIGNQSIALSVPGQQRTADVRHCGLQRP